MLALFKKDITVATPTIIFSVIFLGAFTLLTGDSAVQACTAFFLIIPISLCSIDSPCLPMILSLPVTKKQFVVSRYISTFLLSMFLVCLFVFFLSIKPFVSPDAFDEFLSGSRVIFSMLSIGAVSLIVFSISMPFNITINMMKNRAASFITMFLSIFIGSLAVGFSIAGFDYFGAHLAIIYSGIALLCGIILYIISMFVSIKVIKRHNF